MTNRKAPNSARIVQLLAARQVHDRGARDVQTRLQVTESAIDRLGLETELVGHTGCVNCLEWNDRGTVLASASDDVNFILWDPFRHKRLRIFETGHRGNIFTVKFLPKSHDGLVATGAGDCDVRVHDVEKAETTLVCSCHSGRVKRIATAPFVPHMFWSAAEDGYIMEFDLRTPHVCLTHHNKVLVNLAVHAGRNVEAKCVAVNPRRPELLAVGANDPYIRLYDRRMIRPYCVEYPDGVRPRNNLHRNRFVTGQMTNNLPDGCVQYFVAGHLPIKAAQIQNHYRTLSTTYLAFSSSGNDLLVNVGGEQIYLFDINSKEYIMRYAAPSSDPNTCAPNNGFSHCSSWWRHRPDNPAEPAPPSSHSPPDHQVPTLESLRLSANALFEKQKFTSAICKYNKAISLYSDWPVIYSNRAAALMRRGWDGDIYAALRDCRRVLNKDSSHVKAHFRMAKCLLDLECISEARQCLNDFKDRFPEQQYSHACKALSMDVQNALDEEVRTRLEKNAASEEDERIETEEETGGIVVSREVFSTTGRLSEQEQMWRAQSYDYQARFCGHCNTTTDIKEANFFGSDGQYIVAGSDDGSFFIWERSTTNIVQVLKGDDSIVNCLQPHPSACLLATSGIDPVVRLWSPLPEDGEQNSRRVRDLEDVASANQRRMNTDPFEVMLSNMAYRNPDRPAHANGPDDDDPLDQPNWANNYNCRTS